MSASLGPPYELFLDPQPRLLERISGIEPEPGGVHVLLEPFGIRSTQRLALSGLGGGLVTAIWPGELKTQAEYLYGQQLATPMVERARERGWLVKPNVHLAFRNSSPAQRVYLRPGLDALEYARRWEGADLRHVGQYERAKLVSVLWPWLKERGYADDADDPVLEEFMTTQLGNRPAYLRPGMAFEKRWEGADSRGEVAASIRSDVNAILAAAREPSLPPALAGQSTEAAHRSIEPESQAAAAAVDRGAARRQPIPERVRHEVWRRDQGRCVDCGSRERLEFDHIVPVSRGGSNTARNIELRCELCNRRKSAGV